MQKGEFYTYLIGTSDYSSKDLQAVIEKTVQNLIEKDTNSEKPGMLLGKIQSGKTRAFLGIIALAFDNGFDMCIVLTKGTKALAKQTYERLKAAYSRFIEDDKFTICDIMHLPQNFTHFQLRQKLVIVVKKETNNLRRVMYALETEYPDLIEKKLLIIDDEADLASVGFHRTAGMVEMNRISSQIEEIRRKVDSYDYLQVTATPYSLYLQPENLTISNVLFKPVRPAFTVILPVYPTYIGGEYYFDNPQAMVYEEVPIDELEALKQEDRRSFKIEDVLISPKVEILRKAIMNFLVGVCILRIKQDKNHERQKKYSFIVHTEHARASHAWQEKVVIKLKEYLTKSTKDNQEILDNLIKISFDDLSQTLSQINLPSYEEVKNAVYTTLKDDYLMITKVNSESDEVQLLDERGQLYLRTPMNIFIGGQILDRGLTIDNLIGFYYGRRPQRMQQDTVLQHSRMYGNRSKEDLSVTRFYTARRIYEIMKKIHEFDTALRGELEKGIQDPEIVFIHKDSSGILIPCSPNKILLSSVTTLKPFKRLLPVGFQTDHKTNIKNIIEYLDNIILNRKVANIKEPFLIDLSSAENIIDEISKTLKFEEGFEWDIKAFKASLEYLSKNSNDSSRKNKVWCIVRTNRNISRFKADNSFSDAPDTAQDETSVAKSVAINIPGLILIRQNGEENVGWRGFPFWWPILMTPQNTKVVIFSSEVADEN